MKHTMSKSIIDYLPKPKASKSLTQMIQVHLDTTLVTEVRSYMDDHQMTWKDFFTACLMSFRDTVIRKK